MRTMSTWVLASAVVCCLAVPAVAADEAGRWYAQGETQLKQGQIDEAARSFLQAARQEPKNAAYVDRAMTLRRVIGMRQFVAKNPPSPRWEKSVLSLHLFYVQNDLPQLAVALDEHAHQQLRSAQSAGWLAESYLEVGKNVEAANLLGEFSGRSRDLATLHGIALARLGRADAARRVRGTCPLPADASPGLLFDASRLQALLGESDPALATLRTCFEKTPPQGLDTMKKRVRTLTDFQSLAALPAFADVLRTESKVKQGCSGGKDCGSCPLRGRCGGKR